MMESKKLWLGIICLVLLTGCIASTILSDLERSGSAEKSQTVPGSSVVKKQSSGSALPAESDSRPVLPEENGKQPDADAPVYSEADPDLELPEIEIPAAKPDLGVKESQGTKPEPENEEQAPESGGGDIFVDENGDILLPEVP